MTALRSNWYFAAGRTPYHNSYVARNDNETTRSLALGELAKLRKRSMRKGIWYQTLTRVERGIVDLTLRCVERVRSRLLEGSLVRITGKLRYVLDHFFTWMLESIGKPIAERLCRAASSLGVERADGWKDDPSYIQLLGLNSISMNTHHR